MKMKWNPYIKTLILTTVTAVLLLSGGCSQKEASVLNPDAPTALTIWHAYNAVAKTEFDMLIQEFNETVGMEEGIVIDARGYGSSAELEDALYASVNHMIGSDPLPNIFTSYPDNAYRLDQLVPLVSFDDYFSEDDFLKYRAEFLEEGVWDDSGAHKMIPAAKSTELLYLNQTDWEPFSRASGVSKDLLETWEGLLKVSELYYNWSGGSPFLGINSYNDFAILTAAQLESDAFDGSRSDPFSYSRETARKAWEVYYVPHIKGWFKSSVYNQDGIKSGKLMAYIGSSAGAGFFPDEVIENDTQTHPIECEILPYPTFQNGTAYMTQRGANMAVFASDQTHEYAAVRFLTWFTEPEQNIRFAVSTGYLPVENKSLESVTELVSHVNGENNAKAVELSLHSSLNAMNGQMFYVRKPFNESYNKVSGFASSLEDKTSVNLEEMNQRIENGEDREALKAEYLSEEQFNIWYDTLLKEMAGKNNE